MSVPPNSEAAVAFLLAWTAKVTVLLGLACAAAFALRRHSAALRHQVWAIAIVGSLALPLLSIAVPAWHADALSVAAAHLFHLRTASMAQAHIQRSSGVSMVMSDISADAPASPYTLENLAGLIFALWALGASLVLLRLFAGLMRLGRISAYSKIVRDASWTGILADLRKPFDMRRSVRLIESASATTMPMTWGIFRPWIVLPAGAGEWAEERRRIVLSHELAHVCRCDWLLQICGEVLRACFWFHPLAWIAANRLRQESERACDDAVLNSGIAAPEYASQLLALAQTLKTPGQRLSLALAIARPSNLERRFAAMLSPSIRRNSLSRKTSLLVILFAACLLLPLAALGLSAQTQPPAAAPTVPVAKYSATAIPANYKDSKVTAEASAAAPATPTTSHAAPAQAATTDASSIAGEVHDPSGAAIAGSQVTLTDARSGQFRVIATDASGAFAFPQLPAGTYDLAVSQPGFKVYQQIGFSLAPGEHLDVHDINLAMGAVSQEVTVSASRNGPAGSPASPAAAAVSAAASLRCAAASAQDSGPSGRGGSPQTGVGGQVTLAMLKCTVPPAYPDVARTAGVTGTVTIQTVIGKDGTLLSPRVVNAASVDPALVQSALDAIGQWRYTPARLNGEPVETITEINVVFTLTN